MVDLIGGSLSEIEDLAATSRDVGDTTSQVFADVQQRTTAFTGDIEQMAQRLQADFEEFTGRVEAEAARLSSQAGATNWAGRSGDAKRERLAQVHADAAAFESRAMQDVTSFRSALTSLVDEHYDHIATDMGRVIEQMREVHEAEATHAASFAQAARDLDQSAALG